MLYVEVIVGTIKWFILEFIFRKVVSTSNRLYRRIVVLLCKSNIQKVSNGYKDNHNIRLDKDFTKILLKIHDSLKNEDKENFEFSLALANLTFKKIDKVMKNFFLQCIKDAIKRTSYISDLISEIRENMLFGNGKLTEKFIIKKIIRNNKFKPFDPETTKLVKDSIYYTMIKISRDEEIKCPPMKDIYEKPKLVFIRCVHEYLIMYTMSVIEALSKSEILNQTTMRKKFSKQKISEIEKIAGILIDENCINDPCFIGTLKRINDEVPIMQKWRNFYER